MTLEQLAQCGAGWAQERAQVALEATDAVKSGQISRADYIELMKDLVNADQLNKDADNIELKAALETAILGLISIAGSL
jgi:hypothetical protein